MNRILMNKIMLLIAMALLFVVPKVCHAQVEVRNDLMYFGPELIEFKDLTKAVVEFSKVNVIIPEKLKAKGKVFIIYPEGMNRNEAWESYIQVLQSLEVTFSKVGKFKIPHPQGNMASLPSSIYIQNFPQQNLREAHVTLLYSMKHLPATEVTKVLESFKSKNGKIFTFKETLIFVDQPQNITTIVNLLQKLDVGSSNSAVYYWVARHSTVDDIAKIIEDLFMKANEGKSSAVGLEKIITDERTNGLFIIGSRAACKRVLAFIPKLDVDIEISNEMDVVFLSFAKAEELSAVLSNVIKKGQSTRKSKKRKFGDDLQVKITPDKQNNALVLVGEPRGIEEVKRVVAKLDKFPRQIFLEVVLLEVDLNKNKKMGLSFTGGSKVGSGDDTYLIGGTNYGSVSSIALNPSTLTGLAMGAYGSGIDGSGSAFNLGSDIPKFGIIVRMLQTNSDVNIISNPYLVAMDAEEAELIVGSNIPFITGTARDSFNQPVLSIQRQDVALTIKLKPEINERGNVKLKIEINMEDLASMSETLGPTTTKRSIKTTVMARSGSRVAIGGLLREKELKDTEKVPGLGSVPVVGTAFRSSGGTEGKINLLAVITPHIIETQADIQRIFKQKLKERSDYIREMYGEEDEYEISAVFQKKVGMVEVFRQVMEEQKQEGEKGEGESYTIITPDGARRLSNESDVSGLLDDTPEPPAAEEDSVPEGEQH